MKIKINNILVVLVYFLYLINLYMLFPLGCSCKLRYSIERFTNEQRETNLFDWVLTNFDTILYYLENIDTEIKSDDFYDSNISIYDSKIVNHKKIRFSSVHDFPLSINYEENMIKFIEMVNRRLKRLKNTILNSEYINFIHTLDIDNEYNFQCNKEFRESNIYIPTTNSVIKFINRVKNLNNNLKFILHFLIPPDSHNYYDLIQPLENINNVRVHYLTKDDNIDPYMYQCRHWSWDQTYTSIINKNLPSDFNVCNYKNMNPDLSYMSDEEAIIHYQNNGIYENRSYKNIIYKNNLPSDFNVSIYKKINKDLSYMSDEEASNHYINNGIYENRSYKNVFPHNFNVVIYKKLNSDLSHMSNEEASNHYINNGIYENRRIS